MLKKLEDAMGKAMLFFPFLGYYFFSWEVKETEAFGSNMGTDYNNLYYSPTFCEKLKLNNLVAVLVHEVVHNIFLHPSVITYKQGSNKIEYLWILAIEMVTNAETIKILNSIDCGFELPGETYSPFVDDDIHAKKSKIDKDGIYIPYDSSYADQTSLEVYEKLLEHFKDRAIKIPVFVLSGLSGQKPGQAGQKGQEKQGVQAEAKIVCSECGHEVKPSDKKCPHCGKKLIDVPIGDVIIAVGDKHKTQEATEKAIAVAEVMQKTIGSLPSGLERHIKQLKNAQVPWTRVLMSFLGNVVSGSDEYRWERPNYRHPLSREIIMPGLVDIQIDDIIFAVDTSGSMGEKELGQIAAELAQVQRHLDTIVVMTTDAQVHERIKASSLPELFRKLKFKGQGGTDFRPIFEEIKHCACLVFFTDGCATYPEKSPRYPVLWVLTKEHQKPPFGKVAHVLDV